jgi:hypothetical protein
LFATGCTSDANCVIGTKCEIHKNWSQCVVDESVQQDSGNCKFAKFCGKLTNKEGICRELKQCQSYEECVASVDFLLLNSTSLPIVTPVSILIESPTVPTLTPTSISTSLPTLTTSAPSSITTYRNISTLAGNGIQGFSGDDGLATNAQVNNLFGLSIDTIGNVYFADNDNHVIRKVAKTSNIITTIAGNNVGGYSGDGGFATNAKLYTPHDVVVDTIGFFFFFFFLIFFLKNL